MDERVTGLFAQEVGTGFALNDLSVLLALIRQSHSGKDPQEATASLLKIQSAGLPSHALSVFQSLFHFDTISLMNKGFGEVCFQELLTYGNIVLQNLGQESELSLEPQVFATVVHVMAKWFRAP
jgi:hypothetical protein